MEHPDFDYHQEMNIEDNAAILLAHIQDKFAGRPFLLNELEGYKAGIQNNRTLVNALQKDKYLKSFEGNDGKIYFQEVGKG